MQLTFVLALLVLSGACGDDASTPLDAAVSDAAVDVAVDAFVVDGPGLCDNEQRDDEYAAGMTRIGANGYTVVLATSTPLPGAKGNYVWNVQVLDPSMAPANGLDVRVTPFMPDHGHGTSAPTITAGADGVYTIAQMDLFMTGFWTIRFSLRDTTSELDFVVFKFCVD